MTDKEKTASQAEDLVRRVLSQIFNQRVDDETLSLAAEKVARTVPVRRQEKHA